MGKHPQELMRRDLVVLTVFILLAYLPGFQAQSWNKLHTNCVDLSYLNPIRTDLASSAGRLSPNQDPTMASAGTGSGGAI